VKLCVRQNGPDGGKCLRSRARDEQTFACSDDARGDRGNLIRAFSRPENYFREPLTDAAMVIDPGETEVFEGGLAQNLKDALVRRLKRKAAGLNVLQEVTKFQPRHGAAVTDPAAPR